MWPEKERTTSRAFQMSKGLAIVSSGSVEFGLFVDVLFRGDLAGVPGIYLEKLLVEEFGVSTISQTLIAGVGTPVGGRTLVDFSLYDPMSENGTIAFFAILSDGSSGIVRVRRAGRILIPIQAVQNLVAFPNYALVAGKDLVIRSYLTLPAGRPHRAGQRKAVRRWLG